LEEALTFNNVVWTIDQKLHGDSNSVGLGTGESGCEWKEVMGGGGGVMQF
jgi:hypothetical protein